MELNSKLDEGALVCTCPEIEPLPEKTWIAFLYRLSEYHRRGEMMSNTNPIRKTILTVIAVFLIVASFAGCETTKEINEDYLVVSSMAVIPNEEERGALTLKIEGDYAESAWGIRSIEQETTGNTIVLTGTLVSEATDWC